jgi:hypothetical protein
MSDVWIEIGRRPRTSEGTRRRYGKTQPRTDSGTREARAPLTRIATGLPTLGNGARTAPSSGADWGGDSADWGDDGGVAGADRAGADGETVTSPIPSDTRATLGIIGLTPSPKQTPSRDWQSSSPRARTVRADISFTDQLHAPTSTVSGFRHTEGRPPCQHLGIPRVVHRVSTLAYRVYRW